MRLSIKILLYHFFFKAFVNYVVANATRLQLTAQATVLTTMWTAWMITFDLYTNPISRNTGIISDMNGLFNTNRLFTTGVQTSVVANPLVVLTGNDRLGLDTPIAKKPRTNIPVPSIRPNVSLMTKIALTMKIFIFDPAAPAKKKPKDVSSCGYKMAIVRAGDPVPPVDSPLFINQIPEKDSQFEIYFTLPQVGYTVYILAYYLNYRNEPGEVGEMFSAVII